MKPGSYNTQKLAAEAAAMEARLTALKLELQKDKAKREAAAAAAAASASATGGKTSIWGNGQQGPLRKVLPAGSGKSTIAAAAPTPPAAARSTSARSSSGNGRTQLGRAELVEPAHQGYSAARVPSARTAAAAMSSSFKAVPHGAHSSSAASTRPTSTSSSCSSGSLDTSNNDTTAKAAAGKPQWLQQLKQQQQKSSHEPVVPQATSSGILQAGSVASTAAEPGQQSHLAAAIAEEEDSCSSGAEMQGPSLLHGVYDEEEAASSFQEALRQWREAAPAAGSSSCAGVEKHSSGAGADGSAGNTTSGSGSRLLHGTYDEKEAASSFQEALRQWRQAGPAAANSSSTSCAEASQQCVLQPSSGTGTPAAAASGQGPPNRPVNRSLAAFLLKLATRSSDAGNSSTAGSAGGAVGICPAAAAASCSSRMDPVSLAVAAATASVCPGRMASTEPAAVAASAQDAGADVSANDADDASSDADRSLDADSVLESEPFDAWLEQAEQAATKLVSSSQAGNSQQLRSSDSAVTGGDAAGVSQYHQQLDSMLQAVEQLECELQERARPARH